MAINPETQYPGKIAPSDANYPYGSARNITVPGDGTGTPWEAAIVNDMLGWQQALLARAGVVPSGTPETSLVSQFLKSQLAIFAVNHSHVVTMVADADLKSGGLVRTTGYYDGWAALKEPKGGAYYGIATLQEVRDAKVEPGYNPDNLTDHLLANGSVAYLLASEVVDVLQCGARGDGTTDDTLSFQAAALNYDAIKVPKATYLTIAKVDIRAGQVWQMDNPLFVQDGVNFTTVFEADDIADWAILGRVKCKGSLVTSGDAGDENGLVVKGCSRYRVVGFTTETMRSHGIHVMAGASAPAPRGDQGQYTDCAANQGRVGIEIDAASSAEFNVFSNFNAAGNLDGAIVGAGNPLFMGGNVVDNTRGVTLVAGSNHAHGGFIGTQINHNGEYNLKTVSVTNGHTFSGCHFYGNGGATAPIWFENSKGISINGGIVDCAIRCDGTTGQNAITSNYIPSATPALSGTNPEFLRILDNWDDGGAWNINDGASEYSLVARGGSTQAVPAATTLIFNSAEKDKRTLYNLGTGDYTVPTAGVYAIKTMLTVSGTGFLAAGASYVEIQKNGAAMGFVPMTPVSDTVLVGSAATDLLLAQGDIIKLVSQIAGGSPVLAMTSSRLTIELDQ